MKKFEIYVTTAWCGTDQYYAAEAESELDLDDLAQELAYSNFQDYDGERLMAEENGYDVYNMTDDDWDRLYRNDDETNYYSYYITEFNGSDSEWKNLGYIYKV